MSVDDGYGVCNEVFLYDGMMDEKTAREIAAAMGCCQSAEVKVWKLKDRIIKIYGNSGDIEIVSNNIEFIDGSFEMLEFSVEE